MNPESIMVSICCTTYNHENYIEKALDGFLMQKTTFNIEIIVHDDASTDSTQTIIKKYQDAHPGLINPILQKVNQFSQGIKPSPNFVWPKARGKYIALCEADDYWVDEYKLQKQVDALEANDQYAISFHDTQIIDQDDVLIESSKLKQARRKEHISQSRLIRGILLPTLTVVFRRDLLVRLGDLNTATKDIINVDRLVFSLLGQFGGAHFAENVIPANYRRHSGGIWSGKQMIAKKRNLVETTLRIYELIDPKFKLIVASLKSSDNL